MVYLSRGFVFPEMTLFDYHAEREHDSNSTLRIFDRSPAEYYHRRITGRITSETSDPQRLGALAHILILEPKRIDELVAVAPSEVLATNGARTGNAWKEWSGAQGRKLLVKQDEFDLAQWQADSVREHPACGELLKRATIFEQSIFWTSEAGDKLKVRIDLGSELDAEIGDLKSTKQDAGNFWKAVKEYSYLGQAALYCDGYESFYGVRPAFSFLLVGSEPPFDCCVRTLPAEAVALGREQNEKTLAAIRECKAGERPWHKPGYDEVFDLELPPYLMAAAEQLGECEARNEY